MLFRSDTGGHFMFLLSKATALSEEHDTHESLWLLHPQRRGKPAQGSPVSAGLRVYAPGPSGHCHRGMYGLTINKCV